MCLKRQHKNTLQFTLQSQEQCCRSLMMIDKKTSPVKKLLLQTRRLFFRYRKTFIFLNQYHYDMLYFGGY